MVDAIVWPTVPESDFFTSFFQQIQRCVGTITINNDMFDVLKFLQDDTVDTCGEGFCGIIANSDHRNQRSLSISLIAGVISSCAHNYIILFLTPFHMRIQNNEIGFLLTFITSEPDK